jgi:hypothetical protein
MLANGKTREEIGQHFGLNAVQLKKVFEHPQLKGRKTKKVKDLGFEFVEDAPDAPLSNYKPKTKKNTATAEATATPAAANDTDTKEEAPAAATGQQEVNQNNPAKVQTQKGSW